ncbi:MAG: acetate--CoA ligase family protein [Candidatus Asgardarchaeia archaeon]
MDKSIVSEIIDKAIEEGRKELNEVESKRLVSAYDIPVARVKLAKSLDEAIHIANEFGYPVVLKIFSPDILHKSDVGGVVVDIKNDEQLSEAYNRIMDNVAKIKPNARIIGVVVQEYAPQGLEVIVGGIHDPFFGPTIMFGLGGIWVELIKDVTFRIAPIGEDEAEDMIREIKGYKLLTGYRGSEPVDVDALRSLIVRTSVLIYDFQEIGELDLNPIMLYRKGLKAIDARVILRKTNSH